jgi:predicted aldo/keto reductase-like oxidoreductase
MSENDEQKNAKSIADDLHLEMLNGDLSVLRKIVEEHPTTMHIEECDICRSSTRIPFGIMICALPIVDADLQRRTLKEAESIEYAGPLNNAVRFIAQNEASSAEILDLLWEEYHYEIDDSLAEDIAVHPNVSETTLQELKENFDLEI